MRKVVEEGKEKLKEQEEKSINVPLSPVPSLLEQENEEEEEEGGLLSSDQVLVLSCCWQILKVSHTISLLSRSLKWTW